MSNREIIEEIQKEPTDVEGGGMMIYLDRETCKQVDLKQDDEVTVKKFINDDGSIGVEIETKRDGVSIDNIRNIANEKSTWSITDEYEDEEERYVSLKNDKGTFIAVNDNYQIDGDLVNNLTVETPRIDITEHIDKYESLKSLCEGTPVTMIVHDTKGLWQRVEATRPEGQTVDDATQTLSQISNQADVSISFWFGTNSTQTEMATIYNAIETLEELYNRAEEITE